MKRRYAFRRSFAIHRPPHTRLPWQQGYADSKPAAEIRFSSDTLVETTDREIADDKRQLGPRLTYLVAVDWRRAHSWVREGGHHGTGLYTDDGRIRYAEGEVVD